MTKEKLKQIRIDLGLSQRAFANAIGKNYRTIQRMESGEYNVWKGVEDSIQAYIKKRPPKRR
jgi:transcriptional regulator with XRE-family HTH domain